jgi:hypothetical protein
VEVAKAKISLKGITNSKVLYSDFTQETPELKADIVIMSLVLLHIRDTKQILQKLFDISFNTLVRNIYTKIEMGVVTKNNTLTIKEDIPRESAIPPHTPNSALSVVVLVNFCNISIPPLVYLFFNQFLHIHSSCLIRLRKKNIKGFNYY